MKWSLRGLQTDSYDIFLLSFTRITDILFNVLHFLSSFFNYKFGLEVYIFPAVRILFINIIMAFYCIFKQQYKAN